MNRCFFVGGRALAALAAALFVVGSAAAQSTGSTGSSYPYWGTAPESYRGSTLTIPVPGASPNISNAARSRAFDPAASMNRGSGLGGGFLPPFLTVNDIGLNLLTNPRTGNDNRAHIWLRVPADAEVWVNGVKTRQSGESRYYYSPPLRAGQQYAYQMRVLWKKDGKPVEETQRLLVSAGSAWRRDFTRPVDDEKSSSVGTARK